MIATQATNPYGILAPSDWKETTLGEMVSTEGSFIQTGPFGSQLHAHDYKTEGTPVVMPQELGDNRIEENGIARISEEDRDRLFRHIMAEGDIVFSRRGDVTRRAYISRNESGWLCGTGCLLIRLKHPKVDNRFLSLFFSLPQFKDYIRQKAVGATMPNLNTGILQRIPVLLPSVVTQQQIVSVLSSYDELIENNRRRMLLLEESARLLYREWFVRLRFPGHENTRVIEGVPTGWQTTDLSAVCMPKTGIQTGPFGSQLHQSDYSEEGFPVVMPKDIIGSTISTESIARVPESICHRLLRHILQAGDIVLARRGDIGRKSLITSREAGWMCGTGCMRLRANTEVVDPRFLFATIGREDVMGVIASRAQGAIMPNLNLGILADIDLVLPPKSLQQQFLEYVAPVHRQIEILQSQNERLRTARDLLLPRLMSGEIAV